MKVGIIGAGTMGSGIAHIFAGNNYAVYLCALTNELAENGKRKIDTPSPILSKKGTFHALDQIAPENCIMSPFQLTDYVGLDVVLALMETLQYELGSNKYNPCPLLRKMVRTGKLGVKTGIGFYDYRK